MDFENPCVTLRIVSWYCALARTLCSVLLCHWNLQRNCRHPLDQNYASSALLSAPQSFVMLESSENDPVDFGAVNDTEKPYLFRNENRRV